MTKSKDKNDFNSFYFDATSFIAKADELVKPKMWDYDAILALFLISIGLEKILKGILFDVNPLYIFTKPTFEESSEALYANLFIEKKQSRLLTDIDSISFTAAIQKSKVFSKTVSNHFSLLYKLADTRNIIAHNICTNIDRSFVRPFLLKEFRPLINEFNDELKFKKDALFKPLPWQVSLYSDEEEEQEIPIVKLIADKLSKHQSIWKQRKTDLKFNADTVERTKQLEDDGKNIITPCPACDNSSLLFFEPDFDYADGESWLVGLYVTHLECLFCDLNLSDHEEIDNFSLNMILQKHWSKK